MPPERGSAVAPRIVVAGGSIGGLCAGLALHGAGFDVRVYERDRGALNARGAGIVVQDELVQLLRRNGAAALPTTSCRVRRYLDPDGGDGRTQAMPQAFTSWDAIYATLRDAFPAERYHAGAPLTEVADDGSHVVAELEGHGRIAADLVVCADGAQSPSRRRLLPEVRPTYAGYVAWRGVIDEVQAPAGLVRLFEDSFTFSEARAGGHMLVYLIPGEGADPSPGRRRLNWVWYVGVTEVDLATLLVDRDGRRHHASLPRGGTPDDKVVALKERARRELHPRLAELVGATPDPFLQTIVDVLVPRMVFGRVCLLGDAAFVARPHTAGGTAKAARDASALASALRRADVDAALAGYERAQLEYGRDLTRYGVALGERWAAKAR